MIDDNSNIEEITPEQNVLLPEIELPVEIPEETIEEPIIETVEIKPKAKGRPKESKDKIPRPKRKVIIKEEPIIQELPRVLPDSLPIPIETNNINKYALMLELLHEQKQNRINDKSEMYRSWFRRKNIL